jgi:lipoprotein-anchoring transpeptidase ErfK/SrfK
LGGKNAQFTHLKSQHSPLVGPASHANIKSGEKFHREDVMVFGLTLLDWSIRGERYWPDRVCPAASITGCASPRGHTMSQALSAGRNSRRVANGLIFAAAIVLAPAFTVGSVSAQALGFAPATSSPFTTQDGSSGDASQPSVTEDGDASPDVVPERFRRTIVNYVSHEAPGTVIIDTPNTTLYYLLGQNRAIRYGIGVGREGFAWAGVQTVSRKAEWPDWHPPAEMIARQPYLPRFMAGGPGNPLGARAMYLGDTEYRIHGTNDPSTIGKFVSSGCIRLTNEDVTDLFNHVNVGAKVVVLPKAGATRIEARNVAGPRALPAAPRQASSARPDRQAMNGSMSTVN